MHLLVQKKNQLKQEAWTNESHLRIYPHQPVNRWTLSLLRGKVGPPNNIIPNLDKLQK